MLGLAQARQVGVDGGDERAVVAEVDLDLAEVLARFEQVRGVRMAQRVNVRGLFDAAGVQREAEGPLQRGAAHRFRGRGRALSAVAFGGKEERGMAVGFPQFAQQGQGALGQRDVTILVALAGADVQEHPFGINVADGQREPFTQTQAAGINEDEADAMVQGRHPGQHAAHFGGREDDRQFELGIGADQLEFVGPDAFEGLFPEELEGADDLGGSLAGDFLLGLEMDAVLAELLGANQIGRFGVELTELTKAGKVGLFGAGADGEELEVVGEGF
jgi:hypothetical protein